jgi:hypothetical protein
LNNILIDLKKLTNEPAGVFKIGTITGINQDGSKNVQTLVGSIDIVRGIASIGDTVTFSGSEIINIIKAEPLIKYYIK